LVRKDALHAAAGAAHNATRPAKAQVSLAMQASLPAYAYAFAAAAAAAVQHPTKATAAPGEPGDAECILCCNGYCRPVLLLLLHCCRPHALWSKYAHM
jgi:hypothetical protein